MKCFLSTIKSKNQLSQIRLKMVIRDTSYANDGVTSSGYDVPMDRLLNRRCACGNRDDGKYAGTVDVDVDVAYSRNVYGQDYM